MTRVAWGSVLAAWLIVAAGASGQEASDSLAVMAVALAHENLLNADSVTLNLEPWRVTGVLGAFAS